MATYEVQDSVDKKTMVIVATSASAAIQRAAKGRYVARTIQDPAEVGRLVGKGATFIDDGDIPAQANEPELNNDGTNSDQGDDAS